MPGVIGSNDSAGDITDYGLQTTDCLLLTAYCLLLVNVIEHPDAAGRRHHPEHGARRRNADLGAIHVRRHDEGRRGEMRDIERLADGDAPIGIETNGGEVLEPSTIRQEVQRAPVGTPSRLVAIRE